MCIHTQTYMHTTHIDIEIYVLIYVPMDTHAKCKYIHYLSRFIEKKSCKLSFCHRYERDLGSRPVFLC